MMSQQKPLSYILKQIGKIELPDYKLLLPLPNDLVFMVDQRDELVSLGNLEKGEGHEPHFIKTMMSFAKENDIYVEVGANYGDFTLQMSKKIGDNGRLYAIEPGKRTYQCLNQSVYLNEIKNIVTENYAVLDKEQEVNFVANIHSLGARIVDNDSHAQKTQAITLDSYFKYRESKIDILRVDAEGSECKILRGAENLINSSPNLKIFIEWQSKLLAQYETKESLLQCLSSLQNKGFIFLDSLGVEIGCDYRNNRVSLEDIMETGFLFEFVAIREHNTQNVIYNNTSNECLSATTSGFLFDYVYTNKEPLITKLLATYPNLNIDYSYPIGGTALYCAVQNGSINIVQELLAHHADPNIKATNNLTPLYISIQDNNYPMAELLLKYRADTEIGLPSGSTPLFAAAYLGYDEILKLLIEHGANKNISVGRTDAFNAALSMEHPSSAIILAGSTENFCQQIQGSEYAIKHAALCGEIKIEF